MDILRSSRESALQTTTGLMRHLRRSLKSLTLLLPAAIAAGSTLAFGGLDLYVAPNGKDTNPGTKQEPFATLEKARDTVRAERAHRTLDQGSLGQVTVHLRAGDYSRTNTFELITADSGEPGTPITYASEGSEQVRLLGGHILTGATAITDPAVLKRLRPEARFRVLTVDLRPLGPSAVSPLASRGFSRASTPSHTELFADGKPMTLARWPNEGAFEHIAGTPGSHKDEHGGDLGDLNGGFNYVGDRPAVWAPSENIWVHGYWAWDWANSYERVATLDTTNHLVKTAPPEGVYGFRKGQRFYFLNVLEELDTPGEYYIDSQAARLYVWPLDDKPPKELAISTLGDPLIRIRGASNVRLEGLDLCITRGTGVVIEGGASNTLAECRVRLTGNTGIAIQGGTDHQVIGCAIEDNGDGGVSLSGGDRKTLTPANHLVSDSRFVRQGRWAKCYVPAVLANGVGHRIEHNLIREHPHCAILFTGNDHLVAYNEISRVALETGDVGAIYTGRDYTYRGNRIRFNYVHHIGGVGMGSMGAYMDDCVSGTEIYGNIFYKTTRAAFLGGGRDHHVENNIFVDCVPAVQLDGRGLDKSPVWHDMVMKYMKDRWAAMPAELYRSRYPAITNLDAYYSGSKDEGVPPEGNVVRHNICSGGKWLEIGWHAQQKDIAVSDNLVVDDPGFVNKDSGNFRLKADSQAWKMGFEPIPVDEIGPRKNILRRFAEPNQ